MMGITGSGRAARELTRFNQDYASQEFVSAYNRQRADYGAQREAEVNRRGFQYNALASLGNLGIGAAQQQQNNYFSHANLAGGHRAAEGNALAQQAINRGQAGAASANTFLNNAFQAASLGVGGASLLRQKPA